MTTKRTDTHFAIVNEEGHFFSPRSGKCQPDLKPLAHLYVDENKANTVCNGYRDDNNNLKVVRVVLSYSVT